MYSKIDGQGPILQAWPFRQRGRPLKKKNMKYVCTDFQIGAN
jgi:hypothetical protein